jgi:molecular chaperone HscB
VAATAQHASTTPCPDCGQALTSTLACLACGHVLAEQAPGNHFARLGLPQGPSVDRDDLETRYLLLSRVLHPDYHGAASEEQRQLVNHNSALLNEAWRVLGDDVLRAEYLLDLVDPGALERGKALPPEFLMEAMELSEAVEAARASGGEAVRTLEQRVTGEIADRRRALLDPAAWDRGESGRLATLVHELRVFQRILRDLEPSR